MSNPHLKHSWIEWESGPSGVEPILVIETDIPLGPGSDGMPSSELDDLIHAAQEVHQKPGFILARVRLVPIGPYRK